MKQLKKALALLILLTSVISSQTFAQRQDVFSLEDILKFNRDLTHKAERENQIKQERAKEVVQDNEYASTGYESGIFFSNPLMVDGNPLDFGEFNLLSRGELTVTKGAAVTGILTQIPFYVYLKRDGNRVLIPGQKDSKQTKIELSEILNYAKPGDYLVIEAVNKEDGSVKSILKVLGLGC